MVFGLQTQPKSWLTGYTFWVNHYLEIVFSKISVVNPPLNDGNHKLRGSVSKCGYSSTVMLQIGLKIRDFWRIFVAIHCYL